MHVELARTTTSDGLKLDGALSTPTVQPSSTRVDALVLLHGVGGSFYSGSMWSALLPPLLDLGVAAVRVNTRGHGSVNMIAGDGGPVRGGAAFEVVDQCRHDIDAWVDFLADRGFERVGLLGHSLGAIKAVYSQAHRPHPNVACVIAASPPRLSYSAFQNSPRSAEHFESISTAKQHIKESRPEALFTARFPFPLLISAASYLDKYGPDERYNILKFVDKLTCPTLFTYGQIELEQGGVAFAGLPDAIRGTADSGVDIRCIDGADHFYTDRYEALIGAITDWL